MREQIDHYGEWSSALDFCERYLKENPQERIERDHQQQEVRMALGLYKLRCFANRIRSDQRSTWRQLSSDQALHLYLVNKHHWTLPQVQEMAKTQFDLLYLLHHELLDFKLNEAEAYPPRQWANRFFPKSDLYQHLEQEDLAG
ncbi:hypothetical protein WLF18_01665 [Pseudomonas shirazensis]|uniref:Uncharacterized protein n=1 Tax=Pseudomonas shirazensis TaxID=2745494 RepID=A0ABU8ZU02_9PSED